MNNENNEIKKGLIDANLSYWEKFFSRKFFKEGQILRYKTRLDAWSYKINSETAFKGLQKGRILQRFGSILEKSPLGKLVFISDVKNDFAKTKNLPYTVGKNATSAVAGKVVGSAATAATASTGIGAPVSIVAGIAADEATSSAVNYGFEQAYNNRDELSKYWQEYYDNFSNQSNTNNADNSGVSNSDPVAGQLIQRIEPSPLNLLTNLTPVTNDLGLSLVGLVGGLLNLTGTIIGNLDLGDNSNTNSSYDPSYISVTGNDGKQYYYQEFPMLNQKKKHTGGVIPGQSEVLAILQGGETVRTKAQEKALQEVLLKNYTPTICGEETLPSSVQKNKPIYQQITKDDEAFILKVVVDGIERNRMGLRNTIKAAI